MFKGKVIEINDKYSIMIDQEGVFHKIKNYGVLTIGQPVWITEEDLYMEKMTARTFTFKQMAMVATILILLTSFSTFFVVDQMAVYASVVVDVNPSIELQINKHDRVIQATALNGDGLEFNLKGLKGEAIEDAIEQLVNEVGKQGYLSGQEAYVLITTVPLKNMDLATQNSLKDRILLKVTQSEVLQRTNVAVTQITKDQLNQSKSAGVPAGLVAFEMGDDSASKLSVQDFFKAEDNQKAFSTVGTVVRGQQVDAISQASSDDKTSTTSTQGTTLTTSSSSNTTAHLRADLLERLNKLKRLSNPTPEIAAFIKRADAYFNNGSGDLMTLTSEAKKLWEQVKDGDENDDLDDDFDDNDESEDDSDDDDDDDDSDDDEDEDDNDDDEDEDDNDND